MKTTGARIAGLGLGITALLALPAFDASSASLNWVAGSANSEWTLNYAGQPVMVYSFHPQKYKPYIKALHTIKGYNVLRDAPFDHLHHHALMYGIRVNDVNFWEETPGAGVQKVVSTSPPQVNTDQSQAVLSQVLHWLPAEYAFLPDTNAPTLLVEHRTLTVTVNPGEDEVAVHWKSRFEIGSRTNVVTLTGANYHGLGMRFQQELDAAAVHQTPEGKPDLSGGKQNVSAHKWESVSFDVAGKTATIAIMGHPSNARGDARFFSMKTAFPYLSATQGLDQEPLVYRKGDTFELNYLVTLYSSVKSTESLSQRAQQWEKSKP